MEWWIIYLLMGLFVGFFGSRSKIGGELSGDGDDVCCSQKISFHVHFFTTICTIPGPCTP